MSLLSSLISVYSLLMKLLLLIGSAGESFNSIELTVSISVIKFFISESESIFSFGFSMPNWEREKSSDNFKIEFE